MAWCHAGDGLPSAGVFAADDVVGEEDKGEQGEDEQGVGGEEEQCSLAGHAEEVSSE